MKSFKNLCTQVLLINPLYIGWLKSWGPFCFSNVHWQFVPGSTSCILKTICKTFKWLPVGRYNLELSTNLVCFWLTSVTNLNISFILSEAVLFKDLALCMVCEHDCSSQRTRHNNNIYKTTLHHQQLHR